MQVKRRVIMVGATFLLAAATGHLMGAGTSLFGDGRASQPKPQVTVAAAQPMAKPAQVTPLSAQMTPASAKPANASAPAVATIAAAVMAKPPVAAAKSEIVMEVASRGNSDPTAMPQTSGALAGLPDCAITLALMPAPAAMIEVNLKAPCDTNARVVLRHAGLAITGLTSANGQLTAIIPAMSVKAHVEAGLPNGVKADADIEIPSLVDFDRVVVQWQGDDAFELHAFEFGADYGDAGHVHATNPRVPTVALQATGGFLTELGDNSVQLPMLAQAYTFPTIRSQKAGAVRLTIEAQVAAARCGREMLGETLEARAGAPVKVVELSLEMPDCTAIGEFVVLQNLLPDVKVAGN